jgi:SAM-dependent methyltransferase
MTELERKEKRMRLEQLNCPVCNCTMHKLFFETRDFRLKTCDELFKIVKCANCGFIFLNPRPAQEEVVNFYPADFNRESPTWIHRLLSASLSPIRNSIIKILKKYKNSGKLLDIGCGSGRFLSLMQEQGFDVWGCELNANSREFAPRSLAGRIFYKELSECNFPEKSFDLVIMLQSLEHIYAVDKLFQEIKRILKDDGVLYIYVPDSDFFEFSFFGPYYFNLEVPRHLYCFTRNSLGNLLSREGFKVERFFRAHPLEIFTTPTSLYYGIWAYLEDKNISRNKMLKNLTFLPLIIARIILRLFFICDEQNISVACCKS